MKQLSQPRSGQSVWDFMSEVERVFDEAWSSDRNSTPARTTMFQPRIDVRETADNFLVAADLPGLSRDQVSIEFHDGRLTIKGKRQEEHKSQGLQFHRTERAFGEFERSFQLPNGIKEQDIQARMEDGVLEILIPKPQVAKARNIAIDGERKGLFSKLTGSQPGKSQH